MSCFQCQGQTIAKPMKIQADLNEAFQAAMCYVILSRIMSIQQLYLVEFNPNKIYCNENAKKEAEKIRARAINKQITKWDMDEIKTVKISTLNIRSLKKHFTDLKQDDYIQRSDIICVNETWLSEDPEEAMEYFKGFFINEKSKGTAVYSKKIPLNVQTTVTENASIIAVEYTAFHLISVYRYSENSNIRGFTDQVLNCFNLSKIVIILGDINIDLKKDPMNIFTKSLTTMGFKQLVLQPTHILGGILDHVYAYCPFSSKCSLNRIHPLYYSDHDAVTFFLEF